MDNIPLVAGVGNKTSLEEDEGSVEETEERRKETGERGRVPNMHSRAACSRPVQYMWAKLSYQTIIDDVERIGETSPSDGLS